MALYKKEEEEEYNNPKWKEVCGQHCSGILDINWVKFVAIIQNWNSMFRYFVESKGQIDGILGEWYE